jgi:hypothetical protein
VYLIQLLLPVYDNDKRAFPRAYFDQVRSELTQQFGGVTAFVRSPAVGFWKDNQEDITRDDVIMFEVLTDDLDSSWWKSYRQKLEKRFRQENILIRAIEATKI